MTKLIGAKLEIEMPEESPFDPNSNILHTTRGEVLMDKDPKVLIVAGGFAGVTAVVFSQLQKEFGKDLIVYSPEEYLEKGLPKQDTFSKEPIPITPVATLREVYLDKDSNKPW